MPPFRESSSRKWLARAALVSLTLSILCLDELPAFLHSGRLRRRLEEKHDDGHSESDPAAALTALEQAMDVLDEIIAAQHPNRPLSNQTGDSTDGSDQQEEGKDDTRQHQPLQHNHDPTDNQSAPSNHSQNSTQTSHQPLQAAAAAALGDKLPRNHRDPAPQPIQSREKYFGKVFPLTNHVDMPFYLRNTFEPAPAKEEERDIIFYWHIPKTAGGLVKNVMGMCYGLRRAEKLKEPASLEMVHEVIVNVDTSSPEGIAEAHELGLVDSNLVDFVSSSFVLSASSLFTPQHRGRAFTILRHPIDAAASNFHARKVKHPDLRGKYTLAQYAAKNYYIDNWVTRQLTGTLPHVELEQIHVDRAKNILAAKFFVGIYEHMDETMRQLKAFYNWKALEGQEYCVTDLIHGSNPKFQKTYRGKPGRGTNDWAFVANVERYDMELYYFGLEIFSKQGRIWDADKYTLIETGRDGSAY